MRQKSFTNPLSQFKRSSMRYGTQIQEMQVNLLRAKSYEKDALNIYGLEGREPDIHVKYHTMNRRDKYEITLPMEQVLAGAFDGSEDLSAMLSLITSQIDTAPKQGVSVTLTAMCLITSQIDTAPKLA